MIANYKYFVSSLNLLKLMEMTFYDSRFKSKNPFYLIDQNSGDQTALCKSKLDLETFVFHCKALKSHTNGNKRVLLCS